MGLYEVFPLTHPVADIGFKSIRTVAKSARKRDNLVLFGARKGNWYADCSRQVYEAVLARRPELNPVWMTRNDALYEKMKGQGLPVCHMNTPRAVALLSKAPLAVISTQLYDIARFPSMVPDSLRILFTGHGKSAKASTLAFKSGRSERFRRMFERTEELTDVALSTSPFITKLAAEANGFRPDQFVTTGYPRNDLLVHPDPQTQTKWNAYLDGLQPGMSILYAPTWRQRGDRTRFFPFDDFDPDGLLRFLEEKRILLMVRPHERDLLNHPSLHRFLQDLENRSPWIRICDQNAFQNVNHVLPFSDVLITDYSSISNDYLLLDRPMIFLPYDYDEFASTQGFMYDYFGSLPGPALNSQKGLLAAFEDLSRGRDPNRQKRRFLRDKIHRHTDGRSTERVLQIIDRQLQRRRTTTVQPQGGRTKAVEPQRRRTRAVGPQARPRAPRMRVGRTA